MFASENDWMFHDGLLARAKIEQMIYLFKILQSIKTYKTGHFNGL